MLIRIKQPSILKEESVFFTIDSFDGKFSIELIPENGDPLGDTQTDFFTILDAIPKDQIYEYMKSTGFLTLFKASDNTSK